MNKNMECYFRMALKNIVSHGDTDIFPFPVENHVFRDCPDGSVSVLNKLHNNIGEALAGYPPSNVGALAPVGYTGFRWALQIDPLWNAAYLSWVLAIAEQIENSRIPIEKKVVFSYRYKWDEQSGSCFDRENSWKSFIDRAVEKASTCNYIATCDISEFYLRINHHRIENAIQRLPDSNHVATHLKKFLSNLSGTYSFGLPIGGPASRLIAELVLNQIDNLLTFRGVDFIRYADDYYLFADTADSAFNHIVTLTRLLIDNQGLQLQKSKTRIMTSAEFLASNPLISDEDEADPSAGLAPARHAIMAMNVHYDPYSPTAAEDYELLKAELDRYPIMDLIRSEIKKSGVDIAFSRRLVSLVRYLSGDVLERAVLTIVESHEILYPIYFNVLISTKEVFCALSEKVQDAVIGHLRWLIREQSRVMMIDINIQYAIRILAMKKDKDSLMTLVSLYESDRNGAIKRDIILCLGRWREWDWLSDLKTRFRGLTDVEKRGFIIASFGLGDEGAHWRNHIKRELSPMEELVKIWSEQRQKITGWEIPL